LNFHHQHRDGTDFVSASTIEIAIDRIGAELIGMNWKRDDGSVVPIIWRNMDRQPPNDGFWRRHAPILFPIVGGIHENRSVATTGETIHFSGLHGFFRNSVVQMVGATPIADGFELSYRLDSNDATRDMYPWDFVVTVVYTVRPDGVDQAVTVTNTGTRPMPFQLGWHPGINMPVVSGGRKDCAIRLPAGPVTRMFNDENCFLTGRSEPFDTTRDFEFTEDGLQATYMFDCSMVRPDDRFVLVSDVRGRHSVRVAFPDYPHLGVWSDAGAPFVCIEPWQGMDDSVDAEPFDRKFGMVLLAPGLCDTRRASIRLIG